MSKSKGNVVNPLDIIEKFGTDALRMALVVGNTPGNDTSFSESKVKGYRNFANKIWQATRFVLMHSEGFDDTREPQLTDRDKAVLQEFADMKTNITNLLDRNMIHLAAENAYHYFWHTFADVVIEENKERLKSENEEDKHAAQYVVNKILRGSLKFLHPFMPFVTEAVHQNLPSKDAEFLMIDSWD